MILSNYMKIINRLKTFKQYLKHIYPICGYTPHNSKPDKIFIYGFYGAGNLGDEIILESILAQLRSIKKYQFIIISKNPVKIYKDYGITSINPNFIKILMPFIKRKTRKGILLVGGGGIVKDYGNSHKTLKKFFNVINVFLNYNFKTMLYSAGVENIQYPESAKIVRTTLNKFDILTVRDSNSKGLLKSLGINKDIFITGDPAVIKLSNNTSSNVSKIKQPCILISLRHWYEKGYFNSDENIFERFLLELSYAINEIIEKYNAKFLFIPFRTEPIDDDRKILNKVVEKIVNKDNITIIKKCVTNKTVGKYYDIADITIGMRLHSIILSFSHLIPMIALSYSSKVKDFMNEIKLDNYCIDITKVTKSALIHDVDDIIGNYTVIRQDLRCKRTIYIDKLNQNVNLLNNLL